MDAQDRRTVWTLSDGRPGNAGPAAALARALEAEGWPPAQARTLRLRPLTAALPAAVWAAIPAWEGGWPFAGLVDRGAGLGRPWPDLVISAGRRAAPVAAALRRLSGGTTRAVQILDPGMAFARFDAVVAPEHDAVTGRNVIATCGALSAVTPALAAQAAGRWADRLAHLPRPRAAVLLGGPSRSARWTDADVRRLTEGLADMGAGLMITGSRRTPAALLDAVRGLPDAWVWDGAGENPYPGILGLADAAVVTADSANMASEAASAGVPVLTFGLPGLAAKLRRFHISLESRGVARPFAGRLETWNAEPLREAERVAALLAPLLK